MKTFRLAATINKQNAPPVPASAHASQHGKTYVCECGRTHVCECGRAVPAGDGGAVTGLGGRAQAPPVQNPWHVRVHADSVSFTNAGTAPLFRVRMQLGVDAATGMNLPATVLPGETLTVRVRSRHSRRSRKFFGQRGYLCQLQWFTAEGVELFYPVAL